MFDAPELPALQASYDFAMAHPFDETPPGFRATLALIFLVITVGAGIDLVLDDHQTVWSGHFLFEAGLVLFSLGAFGYLAAGWLRSQEEVRALETVVAMSQDERDAWRDRASEVLEGLSRAVHEQFDRWELTEAERDTALMLLKGHSHKRIGTLTDRSDRTVRQHAVAVYRKAGLAGRSELSAFFLEDLLPPEPESVDRPEGRAGAAATGDAG